MSDNNIINNDVNGLRALRASIDVYYNYTGQAGECYNFAVTKKEAYQYYQRKGYHDQLYILEKENEIQQQQHQRNDDDDDVEIKYSNSRTTTTRQRQRRRRQQQQQVIEQQQQQKVEKETLTTIVNDDITKVHSWEYQTCTEVFQPMPTNGITDFLLPYQPNYTAYYERCQSKFGVLPRPNWEETFFGGQNIFGFESNSCSSSSGSGGNNSRRNGGNTNIFLTSGELDPWRAAGIVTYPKSWNGGNNKSKSSSSIIIRIIENGAHHLDLRSSNIQYDPPSVTLVRNEQYHAINQWIKEWKELYNEDDEEDDDDDL